MKISEIILSTSRETLERLVCARVMKPHYLTWYDMALYFNSLPSDMPMMERYARVAVRFNLTEDGVRHIFNKMARYV